MAVLLLEIIGYISTPIYFIIIASFITVDLFEFLSEIPDINSFILIIGIYSLGYLFRAISNWVGGKGRLEVKSDIVNSIERSEVYKKVRAEFSNKISISENKLSFSDIRNIELSKHPEIADKAYLFMFRANLFLDILVINLIISTMVVLYYVLYLILVLANSISLPFELIQLNSFIVLILTLLTAKPLWNARRMFFRMSYSIPITHYLGKEKL